MESLVKDLRFASRRLLRAPGFALIAILSLALGIGANTAIFSLVNTVLLRPIPVEKPEQLVALNNAAVKEDRSFPAFSYPNYRDIRDRNDVLSGVYAYRMTPVNLSHKGVNERVWGYTVTGNYFDVLGVKAEIGRMFTREDDKLPGGHPIAVITKQSWQKRFAGDPSVIGREVTINGRTYTIVGVTAGGFSGTEIAYLPEIFFPMMMTAQIEPGAGWLDRRGTENIFVTGRMKPGITMSQAESQLKALAEQLAREYPDDNEGKTILLSPPGLFGTMMRGPIMGFAGVLMAIVGLVLLLACTNLANLLLARAAERRKEIAVRLALGAGRWRLIRQLLTESTLLAGIGGVLGVMLAYWLVDFLLAFKPPLDIPLSTDLHMDWRVLTFALVVSLLTGIIFGLLPALQATRPDLVPALKDEVSVGGYRRSFLRNGLVVFQITISLILLICAGLVLRGLQNAHLLNPGFNPQNAIEMSFDLGLQGYDDSRGREFQRQLLERVRALPGVQSAGLADYVPLNLNMSYDNVYVEGKPQERGGNVPIAMTATAGPGFFEAMGIRLLEGRLFTEADDATKPRMVVVNQNFARRFWGGESAIGKRFSISSANGPWFDVIGVIEDGKYFSLSEAPTPFFFSNLNQRNQNYLNLIVRTSNEPQSEIAAIRSEISRLDPALPVFNAKTLVEHMDLPLFPARVAATLLSGFGLLALLLAAIGIFGVMSFAVAQRTREIGIRMALGAGAKEIFRLVVGQGLILTIFGVGIGLILAVVGTRLLSGLLYGVSALDPMTFLAVTLVLCAVAFIASYFPARRAMKTDPITALRYE